MCDWRLLVVCVVQCNWVRGQTSRQRRKKTVEVVTNIQRKQIDKQSPVRAPQL